jgi:hypothetical protein
MSTTKIPTTKIDFIVDNFNTEITLDVSGNLFKSLVTMDVSAITDLYVDASLVRLAFLIQTDASDVVDVSGSDIKYFINRESFWSTDASHSFAINAADAQIDAANTAPLVPIMDGSAFPEKNMVCHDFVRYLSLKLFNTAYGVDLFNNELELLDDIRLKSQKVWSVIDKELAKYHVEDYSNLSSVVGIGNVNYDDQVSHAGTYGLGNLKYYVNTDNICKKLLDQMAQQNPARLTTIQNTTEIQSLPFIGGDTISLKLTIKPAVGQENLTGVSAFGARTFRIRYNLIEDHSGDHDDEVARAINENNSYRTFIPPTLVVL